MTRVEGKEKRDERQGIKMKDGRHFESWFLVSEQKMLHYQKRNRGW
jgi:hypothetical protein